MRETPARCFGRTCDNSDAGRAGRPLRPAGSSVPHSFFARAADEVGADLIGKVLWREGVGGGRLVEVEAYLPEDDPACHAACGPTSRNAAMFGPPGNIYVFQSYGVHFLVNIVCEQVDVGSAVLIRAFEPLGDVRVLERNRMRRRTQGPGDCAGAPEPPPALGRKIRLASGPGNVGKALAIGLECNGWVLGDEGGIVVLDDGARPRVSVARRIGISGGRELLLRFLDRESGAVSRGPGPEVREWKREGRRN